MMDLVQEGIRNMIKDFRSSRNKNDTNSEFRADNIAIKAAVEFCHRIGAFNFLFTGIIKLFGEEGLEEKFIANLEPFILSGYFKDDYLPDVILKKICDHYFNNNKYHSFERIVSKLNFSHYALFSQLETICKEKMLTSALIHLIITSTTGNDKNACLQILNNVFNRFKQAKRVRSLDEVKEILLKDEESKFEIEASYEYIGLKLMYIIKLFLKGDKFPTGKISKHKRIDFLSQSIEFIMREDEAIELIRLNSRTFFSMVSVLFLDSYVADTLVDQNKRLNEKGKRGIVLTHQNIVDTLYDRVLVLQTEKDIMFEYAYFIIKIANSEFYKNHSDEMVSKVYISMKTIMEAFIKLELNKSNKTAQDTLKGKYRYSGPEDADTKTIESEILQIAPTFIPKMEASDVKELITCADDLKFDHLKVLLFEQNQDFSKCIDIYLNSFKVKKEEVFRWLHKLSRQTDKFKESRVEDLRNKIGQVIEDLVVIDSHATGYVIDMWLPNKQNEVISKLGKKPELQLQYLESYLKEREEDIKDIIEASARSIRGNPEAQNYKEYLYQHVQLLAKRGEARLISVIKKSYYPLDCLKGVENTSSSLIKLAQAYLKKRAGMYVESINIFLELLKQIDRDMLEVEALEQGEVKKLSSKNILSFNEIYEEILDSLQAHSKVKNADEKIWFDALGSLFKLKDEKIKKQGKQDLIDDFLNRKITRLMALMSEVVEFNLVIDSLITIDPNVTYQYAKKWFEGLYISKNDQELLYSSAKHLLSNENSSLIDSIIEKNNAGFIGKRDEL